MDTKTRGNVIVENIKIGDIHYEFEYGMGIKCKVITLPTLNDEGCYNWKSENLKSGRVIDYMIPSISSESGKYNSQFGIKLYDYEAYAVNTWI